MMRSLAHNLENGEKRTSDVEPGQVLSFSQLRLKRDVMRGLQRNKFMTPTRIQAAAIPLVLDEMDLLIQSKSGTGKTLIYVLGAMNSYFPAMRWPHALIVVPTRELAIQVEDTFFYLSYYMQGFRAHAFIGGTDVTKDRKRMSESRVIIGTPGRLLHLYHNRVFDVTKIRLLVLDEADQLFVTKGLQDTVTELINVLPERRQVIACSATYENNLDERLAKMMRKPVLISNSERATVLLGIRQFVYDVPQQINSIQEMRCKLEAVLKIFAQLPYEQVILFASTQMRADSYRNYLMKSGIQCSLLTGAMDQADRLDVFESYRSFNMRTLVATDVMARGVDSKHANLVINLDPPKDHVTYLHRIGRAGRFGSQGIAITFVTPKESETFNKILSACTTGMSVLEYPKQLTESDNFSFWDFDKYNFPYYVKTENTLIDEMPVRGGIAQNATEKTDKDAEKDDEAIGSNENIEKAFIQTQEKVVGHQQQQVLIESPISVVGINGSNAGEVGSPEIPINEPEKLQLLQKHTDLVKNASAQTEMAQQPAFYKQIIVNASSKSTKELPQLEDKAVSTLEDLKPTPDMEKPILVITKDAQIPNSIESSFIDDQNQEVGKMDVEIQGKNSLNPDEVFSPELTPSLTPLEISQEPSPTTVTPPVPPANSINTKTYCLVAPHNFSSSTTLQPMIISNTVDDASSISSDSLESGLSASQRSSSYESIFTTSDEAEIWKRYKTKEKKRVCRFPIRRPLCYDWLHRPPNKTKRRRTIRQKKTYESFSLFPGSKYSDMLKKFQNRKSIMDRLDKYIETKDLKGPEVDRLMSTLYDSVIELYYPNGTKSSSPKPEEIPKNDKKLSDVSPEEETNKSSLEPEGLAGQQKDGKEPIHILQGDQTDKPSLELEVQPEKNKKSDQLPEDPTEKASLELQANPDMEEEPIKLSIHVTHNMNIAPVQPPEEESDADDSASSEAGDDESSLDEFVESDDHNSSSGFVESNDSGSSGIDTSEYDASDTTVGEEDDYGDDEDDDSYNPNYDLELTVEELECEEEQEDEYEGENLDDYKYENEIMEVPCHVSLAGTSSEGTEEAASSGDGEEEDEENSDEEENQKILNLWQKTFAQQYQFIASHVANYMAHTRENED
ncbi:uncharacterized protein LOC6506470 [Drosophila ananassae]|nr:uncharacterized protein LOC6506470 [Drosophila ananassae]